MMEFLKALATTLWILFACYGFWLVRKWDKKFSELYDTLTRDMEETE